MITVVFKIVLLCVPVCTVMTDDGKEKREGAFSTLHQRIMVAKCGYFGGIISCSSPCCSKMSSLNGVGSCKTCWSLLSKNLHFISWMIELSILQYYYEA